MSKCPQNCARLSLSSAWRCMQLVVDEGTTGTLEVQEAALGGGFAPTTQLYADLVKVCIPGYIPEPH